MKYLIYGAIVVVLAAGGYAVVASYNRALERAAKLESDLATLEEAHKEQLADNMFLRQEKARVDQLLAVRSASEKAAREERGRLDAKLNNLYANNQQAKEWGDQRVPDVLADSLRRRSAVGQGDADPARNAPK